jgi:hypothetical protein
LFLKDTFQAGKNDEALSLAIIIDNTELYLSTPFFDHCGLEKTLAYSDIPIAIAAALQSSIAATPKVMDKREILKEL